MSEETTVDTGVTPAPAETTKENIVPSHDPVKAELEKEQRKTGGKSELEKALYTKEQIEKRIKELQGDDPLPTMDKEAPVTVGMLEQIEREKAAKTALQLADEIADPNERDLTKHYLETRIKPSGNAADDLRFARAAVNSIRHGMIAEELNRKPVGSPGTSSGAPMKPADSEFIPTQEESEYMRSFGLSKEQILEARKRQG